MRIIETPKAPMPNGHYSQAVQIGHTVYLSMQLPINPEHTEENPVSVEEQTHQVLSNVLNIVEASGGRKSSIVKVTVYVSDIRLWDTINEIYTQFMGDHKPARGVVPVSSLHLGFSVGLDVIAVLDH